MTVWALWETAGGSYQPRLIGLYATEKLAKRASQTRLARSPWSMLRIESLEVAE